METSRVLLTTTVVALLLPLSACQRAARGASSQSELRATRGKLVQRVILTGEINATRGDMITVPKLEGWQTNIRWLIDDGVLVKKDDRIADLDTTSVTSTIEQKRSALREARAQLAEAEAHIRGELQEKSFEVQRRANEMQKAQLSAAVPAELLASKELRDRQTALERARNEYDKARTSLDAAQTGARADIGNLQLAVQSAERDVVFAESSIQKLTLRAPSNGLVITGEIPWEGRKLQVGDRVWVGFPLARIPDLTSLEVVAQLWDVDDGSIRVGDAATVTLDAYPSRAFRAHVAAIAPVAQELARQSRRRAFKVRVALDELDRSLMRPGYSALVTIERVAATNALLVPRAAIDFTAAQPRVVDTSGKSHDVKIASCNSSMCSIESALSTDTSLRVATAAETLP